ncbi:MAG: hypothetical protein CVT88_07985 [Candidatus Altiarchaeales archaeon HGW-Altiarchaeales-1]|nr:MAG: hypothetical protein CVT88_07985 [Candidatus Altiarchaeales archaeon HGW-Altiarchaeales-1]
MNEPELKEKLNLLRDEIGMKSKEIKDNYDDINFCRDGIAKAKDARNQLQEEIRKKLEGMDDFKKKKDASKTILDDLKNQRGHLINESKELAKIVKEKKIERDSLNKLSRAPYGILEEHLEKTYEKLLTYDISVDYEKDLFDRIFQLRERVIKAKNANDAHITVTEIYNSLKQIDGKIIDVQTKLTDEWTNLKKMYDSVKDAYESIKKMRESADVQHEIVLQNYAKLIQHKDIVAKLRNEIQQIDGQMTLLEEDLEKIKADKEKAKMKEKYEEVKTKLSGKKHRFTLDEMRILMGAGGEVGISEKTV